MTVPVPSSGFERKEAVLIINPAAHNVPALKLRREAEEVLRTLFNHNNRMLQLTPLKGRGIVFRFDLIVRWPVMIVNPKAL